jgi:hypothetical protein
MRVLIFSPTILSVIILTARKVHLGVIINAHWSSCKVPDILVGFQRKLNFFDRYSKNMWILNFMKIRPVGAELYHAEGQTDKHDEATEMLISP